MRRPPESKTTLWRRSRWGGRGCWVKSSRASFMGFSPFDSSAVRRERSSPRFTTVRYKEPSDRPCGRFSATVCTPEGSGGWDPSPKYPWYRSCRSTSSGRLFAGVRGRDGLRTSALRSSNKLASRITTWHTKIVHLGDVTFLTNMLRCHHHGASALCAYTRRYLAWLLLIFHLACA